VTDQFSSPDKESHIFTFEGVAGEMNGVELQNFIH